MVEDRQQSQSRRRTRAPASARTKRRSHHAYWSQHVDEHADENSDQIHPNLSLLPTALCDPRRSRAARSLMADWLRTYLQIQQRSTTTRKLINNNDEQDQPSVYALIEQAMLLNPQNHNHHSDGSSSSSSSCPLLWPPEKDWLWVHQEQHTRTLSAKSWREKHLRKKNMHSHYALLSGLGKGRAHVFYQCHVCHKVFTSQYYLDLHFQTAHAHTTHNLDNNDDDHSTNPPQETIDQNVLNPVDDPEIANTLLSNSSSYICPATDWCQFLPSNCDERAFEQEPHYGPGGHQTFQSKWETYWWKALHATPCTTSHTLIRQARCKRVMQSCFGETSLDSTSNNDDHDYWIQVCEKEVSCPNRFHTLYFAAGHVALRHVHEWQEDWDEWTANSVGGGWWTWGTMIVLLLLWYWWQQPSITFPNSSRNSNRRNKNNSTRPTTGRRLLGNRQHRKNTKDGQLWGMLKGWTRQQKDKVH